MILVINCKFSTKKESNIFLLFFIHISILWIFCFLSHVMIHLLKAILTSTTVKKIKKHFMLWGSKI